MVFFADVVVLFVFVSFSFKRESSGSNRSHPHTHLFCCSCFVSRRGLVFALFGRASCFLAFFLGCHSGPHAFFGFSWYLFRGPFLDARRQGCFFVWFLFSPFGFAAAHVFLDDPSRRSRRRGQNGWSRPPLGRVIPRGCVFRRGGLVPSFSGFLSAYFVCQRVTGTPRAFLIWGGGALSAPSGPFFTRTLLLFPAVFFFFVFFCWPLGPSLACQTLSYPMQNAEFRALLREHPRTLCGIPATYALSEPPPPLLRFWVDLGGNAVRFFPALCFGKSP